jgi:hypothetical protein
MQQKENGIRARQKGDPHLLYGSPMKEENR